MQQDTNAESNKSRFIALILCSLPTGWLGIHRFYLGYKVIGCIQLFTLGGLGLWWFFDFACLLIDNFVYIFKVYPNLMKDAKGRNLRGSAWFFIKYRASQSSESSASFEKNFSRSFSTGASVEKSFNRTFGGSSHADNWGNSGGSMKNAKTHIQSASNFGRISGGGNGAIGKLSGSTFLELANDLPLNQAPVHVEMQLSVGLGSVRISLRTPEGEIIEDTASPDFPASIAGISETNLNLRVKLEALEGSAEQVEYTVNYRE